MARKTVQQGTGRLSTSLGVSDPRMRRSADSSQNPEQYLGKTLRMSRSGRIEVRPATRIAPHSVTVEPMSSIVADGNGSSVATLTASHNELVSEHRTLVLAHNALLEEHRALSGRLSELLLAMEKAGFLGNAT